MPSKQPGMDRRTPPSPLGFKWAINSPFLFECRLCYVVCAGESLVAWYRCLSLTLTLVKQILLPTGHLPLVTVPHRGLESGHPLAW